MKQQQFVIIPHSAEAPNQAEFNEIQNRALKELIAEITRGEAVKESCVESKLIMLESSQRDFASMRQAYRDHTLEFKALSLAFEAARLAWYALKGNEDMIREKFDRTDAAVQYLAQHILKEVKDDNGEHLAEYNQVLELTGRPKLGKAD